MVSSPVKVFLPFERGQGSGVGTGPGVGMVSVAPELGLCCSRVRKIFFSILRESSYPRQFRNTAKVVLEKIFC